MIVIPAIDVRGGKAVRLTKGSPDAETVYGEDPAEVAARFASEGASWLHVVDLDAALGSGDNREAIRGIVGAAQVPVQVGGGLRSIGAAQEVIGLGATRVVLGTEAVTDATFLRTALQWLGDKVVVALDTDGDQVRIRGWTEDAGPLDEIVARMEEAGVQRLLVTAVARDGTLEGADLGLYERVLGLTRAAVIASGGVSGPDDIRALAATGVESVVVGKALYEGTMTLAEAMEASA